MKNLFITVCFLCSLNYCFATLTTPNLTSPANGSTNKAPDELLDWSASSGQTAYEYRYGVTSNLSNAPILTVSASQANSSNLLFGTIYYWQVTLE